MADFPKTGWIEIITGPMFSGKTEELFRRLKRAEIAKQKVQLFKPRRDNRYSDQNVVSHDGISRDAEVVEGGREISSRVNADTDVVAVDEAQFFDEAIVEVAEYLANSGKRVIVAGLDLDFKGEPFGPMPLLIAKAEEVRKETAVCMVCGGKATRTQRLVPDDRVILVGDSDKYEARCRKCYTVPSPMEA